MVCLKVVPFHKIYRTLYRFSKIALVNFIIFAVLKILHNPVFMKKSLFAKESELSKIAKNVQYHLIFIFIELADTNNSFLKMYLALEIKNVASFNQTRFYEKQDSIKMYKYAECFILITTTN